MIASLLGSFTLVTQQTFVAQNARSVLHITKLLRGGVTIYDSCATDHVMEFPRLSPSVFAYCKQ